MTYTPKQLETLRTIARLRDHMGFAPTLGEIASELRVSTITIFEHVCALERKGALRRGDKGTQRSIEVLDPGFASIGAGDLYRAALARLASLTGKDEAALDAELRAAARAPTPTPADADASNADNDNADNASAVAA